ncbi:hypothetical protein KGA66_07830 [Actinocrinis puniceicyclus]|uniref:Uncharacterized protein n=1 Tax=Actinocrinis puniceicyclus TaxID=977794 RepID=A0A8J8BBB2_9ACTN|nr:hypothetical protein [Actinocrinis puniceicyclus]MBS2962948.1 hypothetical protein [Actinocrinis puniceicyclus]
MTVPGSDSGRGVRADTGRDALELLRQAERIVAIDYGTDERMRQGVLHMIRSTTDMAAALLDGDLEAARAALGHARASVAAATYAVRVLHDDLRMGL